MKLKYSLKAESMFSFTRMCQKQFFNTIDFFMFAKGN